MNHPQVRHACSADIERIIDLCKEARDGSTTWAGIDGCRQTITANLQMMMMSPHHLVLVLERDGHAVGVFIGMAASSWWHKGLDAIEVLFYVTPEHRGSGLQLLDRFKEWAEGFPNVTSVILSTTFGGADGDRLERALSRKYRKIGATYSLLEAEHHG